MRYNYIRKGIFVSRPNRFIAEVELQGTIVIAHVKNTGRCKELLIPGCTVYLDENFDPKRKTKYDLIAVLKGEHLINMDSQAPNKVFGEWVHSGEFIEGVTHIKPECKYGNSRFDFYLEQSQCKMYVETKGVTLEHEGIASFPDAPTLRGVKHVLELVEAVKDGYEAYVVFVIQMDYCKYFTPNDENHREFGDALREAQAKGVKIRALTCTVTPESLEITGEIPVVLDCAK
ncbi:MAG: DNA/RNA nuclease SfsA [Eubacteriales bacterium]